MTRVIFLACVSLGAMFLPSVTQARDALGIYGEWGAFRDARVPRCYAIAKPAPSTLSRDFEPFATIATWPKRNVRGQVHFRLSRTISPDRSIRLRIGDKSFDLVGGGGDAWARDAGMDAAINAAMRSAGRMTVSARDSTGRAFSNTYNLTGVATAMDAARIGCARL
jgi:hypothetical protein